MRATSAKWALFLSGRGSTAQSGMDLVSDLDLRLAVSSRSMAYGLKRARRQGVPTLILDKKISWESLDQELRSRGINRIFLLGFMRIVPEGFVNSWKDQIFNVHPSLLPEFPGAHGMEESFQSDSAAMGVTIHTVTPGMDEGPRRLQKKVLGVEEKKTQSWDQARLRLAISEQRLIRRMMEKGGCHEH